MDLKDYYQGKEKLYIPLLTCQEGDWTCGIGYLHYLGLIHFITQCLFYIAFATMFECVIKVCLPRKYIELMFF